MFNRSIAQKAMVAVTALSTVLGTAVMPAQVSFDHYFATYPKALNPAGEPAFHGLSSSPSVNGLNPGLLSHNPNSHNPFRLDRSQNFTCDQDHD